jgi:hypothetical protein
VLASLAFPDFHARNTRLLRALVSRVLLQDYCACWTVTRSLAPPAQVMHILHLFFFGFVRATSLLARGRVHTLPPVRDGIWMPGGPGWSCFARQVRQCRRKFDSRAKLGLQAGKPLSHNDLGE